MQLSILHTYLLVLVLIDCVALLLAGSFFGIVLVAILFVAAVATVAYLGAVLSTSGRGLDDDEWEVDHSVWMRQLEKDFENSWKE